MQYKLNPKTGQKIYIRGEGGSTSNPGRSPAHFGIESWHLPHFYTVIIEPWWPTFFQRPAVSVNRVKCTDHQVWTPCLPCERTCTNVLPLCPYLCSPAGFCKCEPRYVLDVDGKKCVHPKNCPIACKCLLKCSRLHSLDKNCCEDICREKKLNFFGFLQTKESSRNSSFYLVKAVE